MSFLYIREKSGKTQKEVSNELGVDQSTVSLWETGKTLPRASMLVKAAKYFGCTVDDLLRTDEASRNDN